MMNSKSCFPGINIFPSLQVASGNSSRLKGNKRKHLVPALGLGDICVTLPGGDGAAVRTGLNEWPELDE